MNTVQEHDAGARVSDRRAVMVCLIGLAIALVLVGIVSGTFVRHIVQILPIAVTAGLLTRRTDWGAYAAVSIFLVWIFLVSLIWLFLLDLSRIASGRYTPIEVILTFFMAGFSAAGIIAGVSLGRPLRAVYRVIAIVVFAVLQLAAMMVSFLPQIANR